MELPNHGANPLRLYKQAGIIPPQQILDFSENVHPFGAPAFLAEQWPEMLKKVGSYPDPDGEPFRTKAAEFHQVTGSQLAVGNGGAEVFTWLARRYRNQRVVLVEPAFSEYRQTLEAENVQIEAIQLGPENGWRLTLENLEPAILNCTALYICNPQNPTGILLEIKTLKEMAQACLEKNCELVLDEAFIDFVGEQASFIPFLEEYPNVIVVRSMTKMYAIPGLRLGYVVSQTEKIHQLKQGAAHWNVNALSAAIGADCLMASAYRRKVIEAATNERQKMQQFFAANHCRISDSAVNFLSFQLPNPNDSPAFFVDLLKKGIVLRHTESFRGMDGKWFRIGMKSPEKMEKLREAIAGWLEAN
ncbi:threonine-phosphate decarboxylase [Planococcus antarcticus DSM 14505]|uniref:Aminotransferase n=1 Tax=Planococcus antarcticus DSM 14505 TaxID=1185653 RepID=A0A1C7DEV3_9BACL|nr:aminotransferase class I/II-fold pyridoxal phosphate-dependent enzyme [Planococcus antarcticus]ANU10016.1 threonine-phosphate decarboxylase [Planococcus antarcticus DSM 14505]EIM07401.1 threonine-phosphate decarboxylase [Planococcus antarcticus DSM 14505]